MFICSLSYLQLENRVLPPIGATSRATKYGSLNSVHEPATDIKTVDNEMTTNMIAASQHADPNSMGYNATNIRASNSNESHANTCRTNKGDNNTSTTINLNIAMKNNRTTGQPKLPTLSTETKTGTTSNCK